MLTTSTMQVLPNQGYSVLLVQIQWLFGPDWWLPSGAHQADHQCHQVPPAARTPEKVLHSSTLLWTILFYLVHVVHHASNFGLCNTCSAVPVLICNNLTSQHCLPRHKRSSHQSTLCMKSIALICMRYALHCVYTLYLMHCTHASCNVSCIVVHAISDVLSHKQTLISVACAPHHMAKGKPRSGDILHGFTAENQVW